MFVFVFMFYYCVIDFNTDSKVGLMLRGHIYDHFDSLTDTKTFLLSDPVFESLCSLISMNLGISSP